jgi:hypothetical protein
MSWWQGLITSVKLHDLFYNSPSFKKEKYPGKVLKFHLGYPSICFRSFQNHKFQLRQRAVYSSRRLYWEPNECRVGQAGDLLTASFVGITAPLWLFHHLLASGICVRWHATAMANTSTSRINKTVHSKQGRSLIITVHSTNVFTTVSTTLPHRPSGNKKGISQDNLQVH